MKREQISPCSNFAVKTPPLDQYFPFYHWTCPVEYNFFSPRVLTLNISSNSFIIHPNVSSNQGQATTLFNPPPPRGHLSVSTTMSKAKQPSIMMSGVFPVYSSPLITPCLHLMLCSLVRLSGSPDAKVTLPLLEKADSA